MHIVSDPLAVMFGRRVAQDDQVIGDPVAEKAPECLAIQSYR